MEQQITESIESLLRGHIISAMLYYMIIPSEKGRCLIEWTLAAEEIHNLYDERWRSACADVYGVEEISYE